SPWPHRTMGGRDSSANLAATSRSLGRNLAGDGIEDRGNVGAEERNGRYASDGNQRDQEAVFNHRGPFFLAGEQALDIPVDFQHGPTPLRGNAFRKARGTPPRALTNGCALLVGVNPKHVAYHSSLGQVANPRDQGSFHGGTAVDRVV